MIGCSDIDECAAETDECDDNAACTNNIGSYACACNIGFEGSGRTCQDINECRIDPNICQGGLCVNTEGSFTCNCPDGLTLDSSGNENDHIVLMISLTTRS